MMNAAAKDKIFDIVLAEALKECMDEELEEVDRIVAAEKYELSPQFDRDMKKFINSVGRKDRIKKYVRGCVKAVVSLAAVFGIFFGVLLTQPSVFAAVQNVFRSVFYKYDEYEFVGDELTFDNFDDSFRLGYVPDGFSLSEGNYSSFVVTLFYKNETDKIIFEYGIANGASIFLDNEHSKYSTFYSNDIE
ncbi:MAG: hypothetical protein K2J11_01665, partial [Oscillospiraceae bacterium]|nr:hypothetical protein [Oscillospiraceae bacterium]